MPRGVLRQFSKSELERIVAHATTKQASAEAAQAKAEGAYRKLRLRFAAFQFWAALVGFGAGVGVGWWLR